MNVSRKFVLLAFMSVFLLSATIGNSFMTEAPFEKTASSDSFPQAGKFYTLVGRAFDWASVGGKNVTTGHNEELLKWSVQDVVGDVVLVNRTLVDSRIEPETGENHTGTYDFDYQIAANRTILSLHFNEIDFTTAGFVWSGEGWLDVDVGEHTWAWFSTDLHIGAYVLVGWLNDKSFLDDMLYEVVDDQVIQVIGEKQDCWMLRMPPSVTVDGLRARTETYWVDKDTGIPLKLHGKEWALDGSSGWDEEDVLVHTNIDLGPESADEPSATYTLTVPTTLGFPQAGKFYTSCIVEDDWYMSGETNITYYIEGFFTIWVVNVTGNEAFVHRTFWFETVSAAQGLEELEVAGIQYYDYIINTNTREILNAAGSIYRINMTSLTYSVEDRTSLLAGDIGEETWYWLPKNLYLGAVVSISWTYDIPSMIDNGTYTVTGEKIVNTLGNPQASWILHIPITPSIDGTWNYTENWYSDKDVGIPLGIVTEGWAVDGNEAYIETGSLIDTNVYLGPSTYVFQAVADSQTFNITVVTNSTVPTQTFNFSQGQKMISFSVTGLSGTAGFCNITIPRTLADCTNLDEWVIFANGTDISGNCHKNRDADYTYICIPYNHSVQPIVVKGTWVVPEFPTAIIMPLFMMATLLAVIVYKRARPTRTPPPFLHGKQFDLRAVNC
jgi:hypothetical protein